jgi:cytochrome c oxidase subunit 2
MVPEEELGEGYYRLLETTNRTVLPTNTHIRALTTAADVLHSWAVPTKKKKMDACPGRLNELSIFIKREGVYYGQCSEICGIYHGFMPITIEAMNLSEYTNWFYYTNLSQQSEFNSDNFFLHFK